MIKLPTRNVLGKFFSSNEDNDASMAPCTVVRSSGDLVVAVYPCATDDPKSSNSDENSGLKVCVVSDGKEYLRAYLLGSSFIPLNARVSKKSRSGAQLTSKPFLLRVGSFISSGSDLKDPLLFLTSGHVVQSNCRNVKKPPMIGSASFRPFTLQQTSGSASSNNNSNNTNNPRILGGGAPHFLSSWAPVLRNEALAGRCSRLVHESELAIMEQHAVTLSNFLQHHNAIHTLHHHSTGVASLRETTAESPTTSTPTMSQGNMQYYMSALREFQKSQLDRQKASLTSNSGREDAKRASLIEEQYIKALQMALGKQEPSSPTSTTSGNGATLQSSPAVHLSRKTICFWHSILCGQGIRPEAGRLRSKMVRVGHIHFRPHTFVADDFDKACQALQILEGRLLQHTHVTASPASQQHSSPGDATGASLPGWHAATYAAAVFYAIVDVHGFADGNGRLARIALNWALQKAGLPFVIHLFATPTQRKEYTEAITQTRRNLSLVATSLIPEDERQPSATNQNHNDWMVHALEFAGALNPLVELILDRISKAVAEFEKLVQEKSRLVTEEAEAKAAKKIRDRERAGTCLICFEENPNIATLCCGKAVHLNCVAQWLSSNATCPNCRESFPVLPPRMQAPSARNQNRPDEVSDETFSTNSDFEDDTFSTSTTEMIAHASGNGDDMDANDENDTSEDDTTEIRITNRTVRAVAEILRRANEEEEEDDTSETMEVEQPSRNNNQENDNNHGDNDSDNFSTSSTTEEGPVAQAPVQMQQQDLDDGESTTSSFMGTTSSDTEPAVPAPADPLPPFCVIGGCRNRSARDCANETCGRCCIMHGQYDCERHRCM